jgi:hypothetical protein
MIPLTCSGMALHSGFSQVEGFGAWLFLQGDIEQELLRLTYALEGAKAVFENDSTIAA